MKFLIVLGTIRDSTPPTPARLGLRVAKACLECLDSRYDGHEIELVDALDYPFDSIFKPHFAYPKGKAPPKFNILAGSAIVTYSAGQWGGVRAAIGMRTFLSELGCLPASAMIHVPKAQEVFAEDGSPQKGVNQKAWFDYFGRTFDQLIWWAQAASEHRALVDPRKLITDFKKDPGQRNAP